MGTYPPPYREPTFEPTAAQLERDRLLRRRNRLYIYLPLGIVSLISATLIVLILIGLFAPGEPGTVVFISAVADIIIILWIFPAIILTALTTHHLRCLLRQQTAEKEAESANGSAGISQPGAGAVMAHSSLCGSDPIKTDEIAPKVAEPVIGFNAYLTYFGAWLNLLTRPFRGSTDHDRDGNGA